MTKAGAPKATTVQIAIEQAGMNLVYQVERPARCPVCHHYSQLNIVKAVTVEENKEVEVIYRCGFDGCKRNFIGYYGSPKNTALLRLAPLRPEPRSFPPVIAAVSPMFEEIFGQAEKAHADGLTHIAGPGYRKAFEFMVKDYAIGKLPDGGNNDEEKNSILSDTAAAVVKKYFAKNENLTSVAERVLWLGNDETHYLRKWEEHDITDLIDLIMLAVNWLDTENRTEKMMARMPNGKK